MQIRQLGACDVDVHLWLYSQTLGVSRGAFRYALEALRLAIHVRARAAALVRTRARRDQAQQAAQQSQ